MQIELLALLILGLVTLIIRLPGLHQPFENDSSALAYHARLIVRGEPLYGTHHTGHHLPGIYYLYALAFALFGDQVAAVKGLLMLWTFAAVYLVYRLGSLVAGRRAGFVAALFASLLYGHLLLAGTNSRIESFLGLPQLLTVYGLLWLRARQAPARYFALVGAGFGLTFLLKANNVLGPAGVVAAALLADWWSQRQSGRAWQTIVTRVAWMGTGFSLVLLPVLLYFASEGLFDRFLAVFRIGLGYTAVSVDRASQPLNFLLYPTLVLAASNAVILVAALGAIIVFALAHWRARRQTVVNSQSAGLSFVILWFLLAYLEAGISRTFLHHYYLIFVPSLSILAAWLVTRFVSLLPRPALRNVVWLVLFIVVVLASGRQQLRYHYEFARYFAGQQTHREFLVNGLPDDVGWSMIYLEEIADYLRENTAESDTLYSWSSLMEFYYLADRRSVATIIWPIYADTFSSREEIFGATYFIVGNVPLGYEQHPDWLWAGLAANYDLEVTRYSLQIYRHK